MNCPTCGEFSYTYHKCSLVWSVYSPDRGEDESDAVLVRALDAEDAAEKWAERDDSDGDYTIVGGSSVEVICISSAGVQTRWRVSGETVPQYYARELL